MNKNDVVFLALSYQILQWYDIYQTDTIVVMACVRHTLTENNMWDINCDTVFKIITSHKERCYNQKLMTTLVLNINSLNGIIYWQLTPHVFSFSLFYKIFIYKPIKLLLFDYE